MKRKQIVDLAQWFKQKDRKPLILRGARQVGKSTLVRLFAKEQQLELIEFNLEKNKFSSLNQKAEFQIKNWVNEIEIKAKKKITKQTLLFIDEIQNQPQAIAFLRYFYEEKPEIAVVCAGSLLEIVLSKEEISFPVGRVSFLWISPMTFTEYLQATDQEKLAEAILQNKIPEYAHEILQSEVIKYFYLGGMPKVIQTYIDTQSMLETRKVQREILESYEHDFPKYEKRVQISRIASLFSKVPFFLGKKVIYQHLDADLKSILIKDIIQLFIKAHLVYPCYHVNINSNPLKANIDLSVFKLYFLDIGLVNCMHDLEWSTLQDEFENSFTTKGFLAEQFIAQHLTYSYNDFNKPELYYWLKDKTIGKAEIDFIVPTEKNNILPVEIKAGKGGRLKSFEVFSNETLKLKGIKFSAEFFHHDSLKVNHKNIKKNDVSKKFEIENWPYYAIEGFIQKNMKRR